MTKTFATAPQRPDIEALLPWHAAGTLSRRDAERVEAALANDNDLARQYELVREELGETIRLNETLGAPSARAMERLMAAIEADATPARKPRVSFNIGAWIAAQLAQLSPRTLAWSAAAAALAIVLQAGLIAGLFVEGADQGPKRFETASFDAPQTTLTRSWDQGAYVLVRFAPAATAADITKFLETNKAVVVEGPRGGGLFRLRVAETSLPKEEFGRIVTRMQADRKLISFVGPSK